MTDVPENDSLQFEGVPAVQPQPTTVAQPGRGGGRSVLKWIAIIGGAVLALLIVFTIVAAIMGSSGNSVEFGSGLNHLHIAGKSNTLSTGHGKFAWVASMSDAVGSTSLTLQFREFGSHPRTVYSRTVHVPSAKDNIIASEYSYATLATFHVKAPGKYQLRLLRGAKVLAEGDFTLVK